MTKKKMRAKYLPWISARKRFRLSDVQIQMARELEFGPKKYGSSANTKERIEGYGGAAELLRLKPSTLSGRIKNWESKSNAPWSTNDRE